ncbi:HET-domain-containing protein [Pisolithus marmoratus]|nr:HET-domain-containing protein [Pisolithus marmoratus]
MVELHGAELKYARYAILSHCWGVANEEVQFKEMSELLTTSDSTRNKLRSRAGYMKILGTCERAQKEGFELVWIDTCCINKESSSELSEAINSMYKWCADSRRCYAYLQDVETSDISAEPDSNMFPKSNGLPKWFSRGWTLQELVAPKDIRFFNSRWKFIGDKKSLVHVLNWITQIPLHVLEEGLLSKRPSVAQITSWASHRSTAREEDRAYSLMGLLGVHMPMSYGEGKNAFRRLQLEIMRTSNDQSIFAWGWQTMHILQWLSATVGGNTQRVSYALARRYLMVGWYFNVFT